MAEALALSAAVVFGVVHFASGLLARPANSYAVALYGQFGGSWRAPHCSCRRPR